MVRRRDAAAVGVGACPDNGSSSASGDGGGEAGRSAGRQERKSLEVKERANAKVKGWSPVMVVGLLTAVVIVPRVCVVAYYYAHLHAGWDRPAVALHEERPLLIVGTMGSGTKQMVVELGRLGIEMGHENSDTTSHFARDGTISWTHGLRFLPPAERRADDTRRLCQQPRYNSFHTTMFRPSDNCSYHFTLWSDCWRRECTALWESEFGCHHSAPHNDGHRSPEQSTCASPFSTALLQVRHPLRVMASLLAKSGPNCDNAVHQIAVIRAMFPTFDWDNVTSCAEFWGRYWLLYNRAMLPHVDGWYRVEHTPPCEVARRGGVLHGERGKTATEVCLARRQGEGPGHGERHGTVNRKNRRQVTVSWTDVKGLPMGLGQEMAELATFFGYMD